MRALRRVAMASVLTGLVAGCGEAAHPVCRDQDSTTKYGVAWQEALAKARQSGKLRVDQVVALQGKAFGQFGKLSGNNWSAFCRSLDDLRREAGF